MVRKQNTVAFSTAPKLEMRMDLDGKVAGYPPVVPAAMTTTI